MTNRAQDLIKSYYDEEALRKESELTFSDFSVRLNTSDIAMLEVIAKRFGKSSDRIASEAVSAAIFSMVEAINTSERKQMSKEADELNESLSKKAARANGNSDFDEKSVTWVMNDRAITRDENKRKKEVEEKQPEVAPAIETAETTSEETVAVEADQSESQQEPSYSAPAESAYAS